MSTDVHNPDWSPRPNQQTEMACAITSEWRRPLVAQPAEDLELPPAGHAFLQKLARLRLLRPDEVSRFVSEHRPQVQNFVNAEEVGNALIKAELLTNYQLDRVLAGTTHGLVLGNYKIVGRLGAGAMGIVFQGQHLFFNRVAAVKVVPTNEAHSASPAVDRFCAEMRVLADLNHPNIVTAYEAGQEMPTCAGEPILLYLAMEFLPAGDLEQYVYDHGTVAFADACRWIAQAACGVQKAHDHKLVHRDIKPSNLLLTEEMQVKVSDFGLVKQFGVHLTDPQSLVGTIDFMAPEQSENPTVVGSAADVYALGASLFFLLTGEAPYPAQRKASESLKLLREDEPRPLRSLRADVPDELDSLVGNMMHRDPTRRPLPITAMKSLLRIVDRAKEVACY